MTTLSSLLREKDEIIERLQLLNRPVADLSLETLKSIITMKERLSVVNSEIDIINSALFIRIDVIEKLIVDLKQSVENKLRVFRSQLVEGKSDDKYIDIITKWSSDMEEKLKEAMEFALSCTEEVKKLASDGSEEKGDVNQKVAEPGQPQIAEIGTEHVSSEHYGELGTPENRYNNESNKPEAEHKMNPAESDAANCEKTSQPISPDAENNELKKLNECIQNSVNRKMKVGKTITDIIHLDTYLSDNSEVVKKLHDFIEQNNKLQQNPLINHITNEERKKKHPVKYETHGKKDSVDLFEMVNKDIGMKELYSTLEEAVKPVGENVCQHERQVIEDAVAEAAAARADDIIWGTMTLEKMPPSFIYSSEEEGVDYSVIDRGEDDPLPSEVKDTKEDVLDALDEIPVKYPWSWLGEDGSSLDRILAGIDKEDTQAILDALEKHLEITCIFPFEAKILECHESGPLKQGDRLSVKGISGVDDFYGINVETRRGRKKYHVPLMELEVTDKKSVNYQPVEVYKTWFANRY